MSDNFWREEETKRRGRLVGGRREWERKGLMKSLQKGGGKRRQREGMVKGRQTEETTKGTTVVEVAAIAMKARALSRFAFFCFFDRSFLLVPVKCVHCSSSQLLFKPPPPRALSLAPVSNSLLRSSLSLSFISLSRSLSLLAASKK